MTHNPGDDTGALIISPQAIHQAHIVYHGTAASDIKSSFGTDVLSILHWDGQMMPKLTDQDQEQVEYLPMTISGKGVKKLLTVPKLPHSKG